MPWQEQGPSAHPALRTAGPQPSRGRAGCIAPSTPGSLSCTPEPLPEDTFARQGRQTAFSISAQGVTSEALAPSTILYERLSL